MRRIDGRWKSAVNMQNPLGTNGAVAHAFAKMVHDMWQGDSTYLTPYPFRVCGSENDCSSVWTDGHPISTCLRDRFALTRRSSEGRTNTTLKSSSTSCWMVCMRISTAFSRNPRSRRPRQRGRRSSSCYPNRSPVRKSGRSIGCGTTASWWTISKASSGIGWSA